MGTSGALMDVRSRGQSVHDDTDHNAALVQQFLNIALAQGKPVVKPKGVLDDAQQKAARRGQPCPFWPRPGVGKACGQSQRISLLRLSCQNHSRWFRYVPIDVQSRFAFSD